MTNHTKKYLDYLESPAWQTKRQEVFAVRGYNCEACRSSQVLQVHHKTYARLGREYAQDMAVLCRDCHEEVHRLARRGSLAVATDKQQLNITGLSRLMQCPKRRYCDLVTLHVLPDRQIEACRFCGVKRLFRLDEKGRTVDPKGYKEAHIRHFAQPHGPTARVFYEIYGTKPVKAETERINALDKKERDRKDMLLDGARWLEKGEVTHFL